MKTNWTNQETLYKKDTRNKVVYIWQNVNNFTSKRDFKVIVVSYDKYNLNFMLTLFYGPSVVMDASINTTI